MAVSAFSGASQTAPAFMGGSFGPMPTDSNQQAMLRAQFEAQSAKNRAEVGLGGMLKAGFDKLFGNTTPKPAAPNAFPAFAFKAPELNSDNQMNACGSTSPLNPHDRH